MWIHINRCQFLFVNDYDLMGQPHSLVENAETRSNTADLRIEGLLRTKGRHAKETEEMACGTSRGPESPNYI